MSETQKVDRATAEEEFNRFVQAARIKMDRVRNVNDKRDLEDDKQRFIEEIMDGRIAVDQEGIATVITDDEDLPEVRFPRRVTAMALAAADRRKKDEDWGKMIQQISAATGIAAGRISKLGTGDFMNLLVVFGFFLES